MSFGNVGGLNLNTLVAVKKLMPVQIVTLLLTNLCTIFVKHTPDNLDRANSFQQEFLSLHANYCRFPTDEKLSFETELVCKIIKNLKRGKAPDIQGLTAEHLLSLTPCPNCSSFQVL